MMHVSSPTSNTYFNSFKTLIFNNIYVWVDSISDETIFLDVDAIFKSASGSQARTKLPHSWVYLGWLKVNLRLLRIASPALAKMFFFVKLKQNKSS